MKNKYHNHHTKGRQRSQSLLTGITLKALCLCMTLSAVNPGHTKDLGRYGEAFPIGEMSLMDLIDERLKALQQSGALAEWEKSVVKQVKNTMARPLGKKLTTTNQPEVFYYTPSFTLNRDITDHTGKIIYKKGLTINSLDPSTYPKSIQGFMPIPAFFQLNFIFINGDDPAQLNWCRETIRQLQAKKGEKREKEKRTPFTIILTSGHVFDVVKRLNHPVKFDQGGVLVQQLGIKAVPSIVSLDQAKAHLKITEIGAQQLKGVFHV